MIHARGLKKLDASYGKGKLLPEGTFGPTPKKKGRPPKALSRNGFTLIELLVVVVIVVILVMVVMGSMGGMRSDGRPEQGPVTDQAYKVLQAQGFKEITLTGHRLSSYCGCGEEEYHNTGFTAIGVNGTSITGCVCWSASRAMTVHYK